MRIRFFGFAANCKNQNVTNEPQSRSSYSDLSIDQRKKFRSDIYLMSESINQLIKTKKITHPGEAKI